MLWVRLPERWIRARIESIAVETRTCRVVSTDHAEYVCSTEDVLLPSTQSDEETPKVQRVRCPHCGAPHQRKKRAICPRCRLEICPVCGQCGCDD